MITNIVLIFVPNISSLHILIRTDRKEGSILNENEFHVPQNSNNPDGQPHYPMNQKYSPHAGQSQITQQGSAPISPPPSIVPRQR